MKVVSLDETDLTLPDIAKMARGGTVILTRKGKPMAAVKDLSNFDWESVALSNNPQFRALIEDSRRSCREAGSISLEDIHCSLGLKKRSKRKRKS